MIYINTYFDLSLFLDEDKVTSYSDERTPYGMKENTTEILKKVKYRVASLFNCFLSNHFKDKSKKFHFLFTSSNK